MDSTRRRRYGTKEGENSRSSTRQAKMMTQGLYKSKNPIVYLNDGKARFTIEEILLDTKYGSPYVFSDFVKLGLAGGQSENKRILDENRNFKI